MEFKSIDFLNGWLGIPEKHIPQIKLNRSQIVTQIISTTYKCRKNPRCNHLNLQIHTWGICLES